MREADYVQSLGVLFILFYAQVGMGWRVFRVGRPHPGPLPEGEGEA
jgi:hypothetical protein